MKRLFQRLKPLTKQLNLVKHTPKDIQLSWHLIWWSVGFNWEWLDYMRKGQWTKVQYFHLIILTVRTTQGFRTKEYLNRVAQNELNRERKAERIAARRERSMNGKKVKS